jgi:hypothetical protein
VPNFSWITLILVRCRVPILDNGGTGLITCSRQPEYRDPATLFGGPKPAYANEEQRHFGPPNEKGTHSAHQMLRAK